MPAFTTLPPNASLPCLTGIVDLLVYLDQCSYYFIWISDL